MTKHEVLTQLNQKELKPKKAYRMLYPKTKERKPRRASFVKVSINVPDSRGVNIFLKILLLLPIPIFIIKWVVKKRANVQIGDQMNMTPKELIDLISFRGVKVDIKTATHERVLIKTI
jgi:hypothetical protein